MDIFSLPDDIITDNDSKSESIIFHYYSAPIGSFNGKGILNKNAISLVVSGEKIMHFAEKIVHVKDDEIHFLSKSNCLVSMKLSDKITFKSILIFFDDKILANFHLKYDRQIAEIKGKQRITNEPYLTFQKDSFVLNFIESLNLLFQKSSAISPEMKLLKFEELMLHLLEQYPNKILSFQCPKNKELDDFEIRKAVETNITSNISIEDLAFLCNTSLSTFKRRFTKIYGTSPNKWILQKRMEIAKDLLQHHCEKPSEVFYKVGYENHSSFTQSFKQIFGMTPKEFQKQQLNPYQ
jgi:AraC family transcriptional regulator, exoenzyme S synthesis regulatory protein ExsA